MGALDVIIVRGKKKKRVVRAGTIIKIVMTFIITLLCANLLAGIVSFNSHTP